MREEKNINFKLIVLFGIILLLTIFIFTKITDPKALALSGEDTTKNSLNVPVDANDWVLKKTEEGKVVLKDPIGKKLEELLPKEQVTDDGYYISYNDLVSIPNLLCSAKGVALPSFNNTIVSSGGESTDVTDQGKKTAYLTKNDIPTATVFKNNNTWTNYGVDYDYNKYPTTKSRTIGLFKLVETRLATPAEAWVLAEFDKNLPSVAENSFERTNTEYNGAVNEADSVEIDGTTLYLVGDTGEEQYVEKRDGKYYLVTMTGEAGTYGKYAYVQHAWWRVKTVGTNKSSGKETDLQHEAEAFEAYIKEVTGQSDVKNLPRNSDGTFKIDYKVSMQPTDTKQVKKMFNSVTNKYIVGPFSVNYLRSATKQGTREKVSFSGISNCILVGMDAEGKELLDEEGKSKLQLGKNYRFVYTNPDDHENKRNEFDTEEDYPYPASDEEFYIEIDYLDDLCGIKSMKFDFQYITAGGSYEYYKGNFLEITWVQVASTRTMTVTPSQNPTPGTNPSPSPSNEPTPYTTPSPEVGVLNEPIMLANVSSRATNTSTTTTVNETETRAEPNTTVTVSTDNGIYMKLTPSNVHMSGDNIVFTIKGEASAWGKFTAGSSNFKFGNISCSTSGVSISDKKDTTFVVTMPRDYTVARVYKELKFTIEYKIASGNTATTSDVYDKGSSRTITVKYDNKLLDSKVKITGSNDVSFDGDKVYVRGIISSNTNHTLDFDAVMLHKQTPQTAVRWLTDDSSVLEAIDTEKGIFKIKKPGTGIITCYTYVNGSPSIEVKEFRVTIPEFSVAVVNGKKDKEAKSKVGKSVYFYNAVRSISDDGVEFNSSSGIPVSYRMMGAAGVTFEENSLDALAVYQGEGYEYKPVVYTFKDEAGKEVKITVDWDARNPDGSQITDGTDDDDAPGSGDGDLEEEEIPDDEQGSGGSGSGSGSGGGSSGDSNEDDGNLSYGTNTLYSYWYYMRASKATIKVAQDQVNAEGRHDVIDVDAENGLAAFSAGIPVELEFFQIPLDLRTSLAGTVWIDQDEQKDSSTGTLGVYDGQDKPAPKNSVEIVVWKVTYDTNGNEKAREKAFGWKDDGSKIDFKNNRLYIDDKGEYSIPNIQVPSKEGKSENEVMSYDVEFIYNGQTYEATEYLKSTGKDTVSAKLDEFQKTPDETAGPEKDYTQYAKDSYIVENSNERKAFDSKFTEIYGKDAINDNGSTTGQASDGGKQTELNYESTSVGDGDYAKRQSTLITNDSNGFVLDQYKFAARTSESGLLLPYERLYHPEKGNYDNLIFQSEAYKPIDEYFHQINLGLLERYHSDLSLVKDLYSSKVIVNNQESANYTFNSLGELTEEALHHQIEAAYRTKSYKIDLYNSDYYYRSSVYNTVQDTLTRKILAEVKKGTDLRLFVTYRISIKNESILTDTSVNEFKDYYDKTFTLINNDEIMKIEATDADAEGKAVYQEKVVAHAPYYRKLVPNGDSSDLYRWNKEEDLNASRIDTDSSGNKVVGQLQFNDINSGNSDYKGSSSTSLRALNNGGVNEDLILEPGEAFEIFVTYEVDREGFEKIQAEVANNQEDSTAGSNINRDNGLLGQKNNIAEITNYSTIYTDESVGRHKTTRYKSGDISGRVDQDSAPDNINMNKLDNVNYFEDDTEFAPTLTINVKEPEERSLDGIVWEDKKQDNSSEGNGIYDTDESGVDGVDVTLVEKIRVTTDDVSDLLQSDGSFADLSLLDYEFEYIWPDGYIPELTSRVKTSGGGKYSYQNFVAGNYVVRFEYGNNDETLKYNGQDYKNAIYQTGMTNAIDLNSEDTVTGTSDMMNLAGKSTLNNEWHDLSNNENARILEEARVSDARDYEPRRMKVMAYSRTITNENAEVLAAYINSQEEESITNEYKAILEANKEALKTNTAMVANTAKFKVDVEKQDTICYKTVKITEGEEEGQEKHEYKITNVDFGLIERPETKINIKKEISKIQLTKNDGNDVVLSVECDDDGNIIKSNGDSDLTINVNKISEIEKVNLALGIQGFKYVAIESSFLNGLDINLSYKFTVINDSETDYIGTRLADMKNVQELYDKVVAYETRVIDDLENENYGLVPFNTGKGIIYGRYIGLHYYTNEVSVEGQDTNSKYGYSYEPEKVVTTTVDQLVDYVDNDISLNKEYTTMIENQSWVDSNEEDRNHKFSVVSYKDNTRQDANFIDNKGRSYLGEGKNNIVLSQNENIELANVNYTKTALGNDKLPLTNVENGLLLPQLDNVLLENVYSAKENIRSSNVSTNNPIITKELRPGDSATIKIVTSTHSNEEATKNMNYDNLAEIVVYSNTVGRRDMKTIPGNSNMIAKQQASWKAGYQIDYAAKSADGATSDIGYFKPIDVQVSDGNSDMIIKTERDAYAARDTITFSEPTGLSIGRQMINKVVSIILIILIVSAIAVIIATILIVFKKTKYDDKELLNNSNKN